MSDKESSLSSKKKAVMAPSSGTVSNLPMISPRHVSAAARGCLVWVSDSSARAKGTELRGHSGSGARAASKTWDEEMEDARHHRHGITPGRAHVGPPPTLRLVHRAGGHEHDSNEGIKQSIMVEQRSTVEYGFPVWGGAGGGYYSCFNYKGGGKDARGRYDGALDVVATKETQGRRRVLDQDHLAIGATVSSFVPLEKASGRRPVRPPQRSAPMDGKDKRGVHQDIGVLNVERIPSRKKTCSNQYDWQKNSYNVMTEAAAPTDTRTQFQIFADAKRERSRRAKQDFLSHLKREGRQKAVNRVPIRSTLTQRRWDVDDGSSPSGGGAEAQQQSPQQQQQMQQSHQQQQQQAQAYAQAQHPAGASSVPAARHPLASSVASAAAAGAGGGLSSSVGQFPSETMSEQEKGKLFGRLSPRARRYLQ